MPLRTVTHAERGVNFPGKFISPDGKTLWLCYSANFSPGWNGVNLAFNPPGGRYGLCLHELRLVAPDEQASLPPSDPLRTADNLARHARIEVSSTHQGCAAQAAVDGRVDGSPGDISKEWASAGEGVGAWIKLSWNQPQTIGRVQLFDRPNPLDQVTGGRLEFSDGSSIDLAQPLPDGATQGLELVFESKQVSWMKLTVMAVKPNSPNIGLAEFAVFSPVDSPH